MNRMSKEAIDPKAALRALPPLIKGYLRLGAYIGDGAVIDHRIRHHRRADRAAGDGDQAALSRAFRVRRDRAARR